jgi:hypothetical protein
MFLDIKRCSGHRHSMISLLVIEKKDDESAMVVDILNEQLHTEDRFSTSTYQ